MAQRLVLQAELLSRTLDGDAMRSFPVVLPAPIFLLFPSIFELWLSNLMAGPHNVLEHVGIKFWLVWWVVGGGDKSDKR